MKINLYANESVRQRTESLLLKTGGLKTVNKFEKFDSQKSATLVNLDISKQ